MYSRAFSISYLLFGPNLVEAKFYSAENHRINQNIMCILLLLNYRLLMMERVMCSPNFKGAGVHWDNVLLCIINCLGTLVGGPFILAAIVRAVAHVNALTVMSTNNAPGEPPSIVDVKVRSML